jgi:integrase
MITDIKIKAAKPKERDYRISDGQGLCILIRTTGSKLWQFRYQFEGKPKTASLGPYPLITLAEAREKRDALRKGLLDSIDPVQAKRLEKAQRQALEDHLFEKIARQWFEHWSKARNERHAAYVLRRLEKDVFPDIGKFPITGLKALDVVRVVKKIEERGALDISKRAFQTIGQICRYAVAHGMVERDVTSDIRPSDVLTSRKAKNYARIDAKDLPELLQKTEGYQGYPATRLAMNLMALTFVRTGELINARWEEFDFEKAQWRIPAERMKMRTPHIVPLSRQAIEVLHILHRISGHRKILFPGERDQSKPMSNGTILAALDRMGFRGRMTGHGWRGLASTILHEEGFEHMHIELQLAHQERNKVSASYNHALYLKQRAEMMQWWADYLDKSRAITTEPTRKAA